MDLRKWSLAAASQLFADTFTDVAVVLRRSCCDFGSPILRKLSHFDLAVFRGNLLSQVEFALRHRAEALDRLVAPGGKER
jgi:hypothetical protein